MKMSAKSFGLFFVTGFFQIFSFILCLVAIKLAVTPTSEKWLGVKYLFVAAAFFVVPARIDDRQKQPLRYWVVKFLMLIATLPVGFIENMEHAEFYEHAAVALLQIFLWTLILFFWNPKTK